MGGETMRRDVLKPVEQETIPFYGRELMAVVLEDGRICAVLRWLCEGLHLDPQGQLQRIQRKTALTDGLVRVQVETAGGPQEMPALTLEVLPGYLFTIDEHRAKPEARPDIILFQRECVQVLANHFRQKRRLTLPSMSQEIVAQVGAITAQIDELNGVLGFLREHLAALLALPDQVTVLTGQVGQAIVLLEELTERQGTTEHRVARIDERTQRLTPAHARTVQDQVNRMVRETMGKAAPLSYVVIYGRLKRRFQVGSYSEIADERFEEIMGYLGEELRHATGGEAPEQASLF